MPKRASLAGRAKRPEVVLRNSVDTTSLTRFAPGYYASTDIGYTTVTLSATNATSTTVTYSSLNTSSLYTATLALADWLQPLSTTYDGWRTTGAPRSEQSRYPAALSLPHDSHVRARDAHYRGVAIIKADKLLDSVLSELQRAQLEAHGWFLTKGASGKLYRIRRGRYGNIDVLAPDGTVEHSLCVHPRLDVPDGDTMAAQKLMLECEDEMELVRLANRQTTWGRVQVPAEVLARMAA